MRNLEKIIAGTALAVVLTLGGPQSGFAGFDEAVKAYETGDYKLAFDEWLPLAKNDDPAAMRNIGHLYRRGLGVDLDLEKAMSWYLRAANMGFDRAQANVGAMYLKGQGVKQDYVKASEWFIKAARNGHVISQYNLGLLYENGKGVEKSASKALAWYNLAAKAGHPQALNKLSILVARDPSLKEDKQKTENVVNTTKLKPAPAPVIEKTEEIKITKPVVAEQPVVEAAKKTVATATVAEPVAAVEATQAPAKKKWDPFAGSANNLTEGNKTAQKGEATVFNQKTAPKPVAAVEPLKAAPTPAPAPVAVENVASASVVQKNIEPEPKSVDVAAKVEPEAIVATKEVKAPKEETGFFSALKSLLVAPAAEISEDAAKVETPSKKEVVPSSDVVAVNIPVAVAVQPAPPAPINITGGGLNLDEQMEMAELSFTLEEYQQALGIWAPLAQRGNAEAQYNLGVMFEGGYAVPVDRVRAFYWWQKAKRNGSQKAEASLMKLEKSLTYLEKRQLQLKN